MSYKSRALVASEAAPAISHQCPARGCPNAASVSFGGGWACYFHAKAASETWPSVTDWIISGWPATGNWGGEKSAHEAEQAAKRIAQYPPRRGPVGGLEVA